MTLNSAPYRLNQGISPNYLNRLNLFVQDPKARENHRRAAEDMNNAVTSHEAEIEASLAEQKQLRIGNIGALAVGEVTNQTIDRAFFKGVDRSWRTIGIDVAAPAIVLSRAPWQIKLGAIVAAHLAARTWDYFDSKH